MFPVGVCMGGRTGISTPSASTGTYVSSDMRILVLVSGIVYLQAVLSCCSRTCT